MKKLNFKVIFTIWNYLGWFGCVYFGKLNWDVYSLFFPLVSWLLMGLSFQVNRTLVLRLFILLLLGMTFDFIAINFKWIQVSSSIAFFGLPLWLISVWLLFISSIPLLQSLFQKKYLLALIFGAVFGPLSYRAGAQFGILQLEGLIPILIYVVFWALYFPIALLWLNKK